MQPMSNDRVTVTIEDHVADVRLNRADKHNGLDGAMFQGLHDAAVALRANEDVRVVVLSGEGKSFCAGLDVQDAFSNGALANAASLEDRLEGEPSNLYQAVAYDWRTVPVPVIAAIHGNCFGGGLQIALGADVRIATPDAKLSIMEIKWGLVPDMGLMVTLPPLVRQDVAKELTFTGRVFSGEEAAALGVVTRTDAEPLAAAKALAAEIAGRSPDAIRFGKALLQDAWDGDDATKLLLESRLQRPLIGSPNQMAAATAAMTKQPGEYGPLLPLPDRA
jgi:enoyl-CoA hydratase/carnithine racemase